MAPLSPFDREEYDSVPRDSAWQPRDVRVSPAIWGRPQRRHRSVLRVVIAVAITAATLVTAWAASDILRDWVSSGRPS